MSKDALLEILRRDARMPTADIALRLGLSEAEVEAKRAELEAEGAIVGYQAVVIPELAEEDKVSALIEVRITPVKGGGFDKIASRIAKFDQVTSCYLVSGGYDLMLIVEGSGLQDVAQFVSSKLSSMEGIISTATHFRLKTYKENTFLFRPEDDLDRLKVSP